MKKIISILPFSSTQETLDGRFLILGKLYFITFTFMVVIFPTSKESNFRIFDLSVYPCGIFNNKSDIFSIFFFLSIFLFLNQLLLKQLHSELKSPVIYIDSFFIIYI